jgi:hypothetical protein
MALINIGSSTSSGITQPQCLPLDSELKLAATTNPECFTTRDLENGSGWIVLESKS